ncbi:hypothetical protein HK104_010922 [Borealophlyctis nickersoniae]|nr:hypothetical protein HK104_010922 [Borealophlyctis nickersoniae]
MTKKTTTLIIEYAQGTNDLKYTLAAGGYERDKHASILDAAQCELSEECRLTAERWISLLPEGHQGIGEVKWSRNRFIPFVALDPVVDETPLARDYEELIEVCPDVTMEELDKIILRGDMMLPAVQTVLMAKDWLKKQGLL